MLPWAKMDDLCLIANTAEERVLGLVILIWIAISYSWLSLMPSLYLSFFTEHLGIRICWIHMCWVLG